VILQVETLIVPELAIESVALQDTAAATEAATWAPDPTAAVSVAAHGASQHPAWWFSLPLGHRSSQNEDWS